MKGSKIQAIFISVVGIFLLAGLWMSTYGINKTIDKTISVDVHENAGGSGISSSVKILGNLRKTLSSASFVGTFAIDYYEPSCRDGVEAKIDWQGNDYQNILFYYAGDFSRLDVEKIEIDEDMNNMMILLKDGTIIESKN